MAAANDLDQLSVNTIRALAMDVTQAASSGHPGMPMGMADVAVTLWTRFLRVDPGAADWPDRDRFVLSAGHGSALLYALLHLSGFPLSLDELRRFRQLGSATPGHPEHGDTVGVETTTGPLGQGFANGVGMALAERALAAEFNRDGKTVVDHRVFGIVSDGDLMEGIASEAASLAGFLGLGRLVYVYDDNQITIEGSTELAFAEDVAQRFASYGWHTASIDAHDREACARALEEAIGEEARPSLIVARSHIAYGAPNKQDTAEAHGSPLGDEEVAATKERMGWDHPPFTVPDEVEEHFADTLGRRGREAHAAWRRRFDDWREAHPELAERWDVWHRGDVPAELAERLPRFSPGESMATRKASGACVQVVGELLGNLFGGSADLAPSNNSLQKERASIAPGEFSGRNVHFGVREHAMAGMCNGIALHGGLRPYAATFLVFSDYLRPSLRLAALMGLPVIYLFTHDSVFLGEDGPTHQPVEHYAALRAIPNLWFIRPADANETATAWQMAVERRDGPTALALTRQGVPVLDRGSVPDGQGPERGGYVLVPESGDAGPRLVFLATGSEVSVVVEARERLESQGVPTRVVSLPCWEQFAAQPQDYRDAVLPPYCVARFAVESGVRLGWERWTGELGGAHTLERFGLSAPWKEIATELGFTSAQVADAARAYLDELPSRLERLASKLDRD